MPKGKSGAGAAAKTPASELNKQIKKFGLSQAQVAKDVGLSVMTLKKLLDGKAKVDVERALVFAKYFGTTSDFWIDLQKKAGLADAKKNNKLQKQLRDLKKAKPAAPADKAKTPVNTKGKKTVGAKKGVKVIAKKKPVKKVVRKSRSTSASGSSTGSISF
jgi:addiction module HigA family antidote